MVRLMMQNVVTISNGFTPSPLLAHSVPLYLKCPAKSVTGYLALGLRMGVASGKVGIPGGTYP